MIIDGNMVTEQIFITPTPFLNPFANLLNADKSTAGEMTGAARLPYNLLHNTQTVSLNKIQDVSIFL